MHRSPEVSVQLEVGAAPLVSHGAEESLEVLLHLWIRPIQRVPWSSAPALEGHLARR